MVSAIFFALTVIFNRGSTSV